VTENPVAVVERTTAKRGSGALARAYLEFLYTPQAKEIAARHAIRPRDPEVLKRHAAVFKPIRLFTVADYFGSLAEAQRVHFNDGGTFDRLYQRPAP
jgi:sulfate transport system substrate-binding protein